MAVLLELVIIGLTDALKRLILFYVEMLSMTFDLALVMTSIAYLGQVTASMTRVSWFSFAIDEPLPLIFGSFHAILPFRISTLDWIMFDLFMPLLQLLAWIGIELPRLLLEIPVLAQCKGIYAAFSLLFYVATLFAITYLVASIGCLGSSCSHGHEVSLRRHLSRETPLARLNAKLEGACVTLP